MADDDGTTVTVTEAQTVPKDRLDKEIERRRALEAANADMSRRLETLEDAGKSDIERLTKQLEQEKKAREDATTQASQLQAQVERSAKGAMLRDAAVKAGLVDPEAAIAFADLDQIGDAGDAKKAVERLAKDKPYLVAKQPEQPNLRQVLGPGGSKPQQDVDYQPTEADLKRAEGATILGLINQSRAAAGQEPVMPPGMFDEADE